jgi:hypothetical protein
MIRRIFVIEPEPHDIAHIYNPSNCSVIINGEVELPAPISAPLVQVRAGTPDDVEDLLKVYAALELDMFHRLIEYIPKPELTVGAKLTSAGVELVSVIAELL